MADVDVTTLAFGPAGAAPAHAGGGHLWDVDYDEFRDLLSHYPIPETGITIGDVEACVTGETLDGIPLKGATTSGPCRPTGSDSSWCSCCRRWSGSGLGGEKSLSRYLPSLPAQRVIVALPPLPHGQPVPGQRAGRIPWPAAFLGSGMAISAMLVPRVQRRQLSHGGRLIGPGEEGGGSLH